MATRVELKSYFETGDIPTEDQFASLIDTMATIDDVNIVNNDISDLRIAHNALSIASALHLTASDVTVGAGLSRSVVDNKVTINAKDLQDRVAAVETTATDAANKANNAIFHLTDPKTGVEGKVAAMEEAVEDISDVAYANQTDLAKAQLIVNRDNMAPIYNAVMGAEYNAATGLYKLDIIEDMSAADMALALACYKRQQLRMGYWNSFVRYISCPRLDSSTDYAFYYARRTEVIDVVSANLSEYMFAECYKLRAIHGGIHASATKQHAFDGCSALEEIDNFTVAAGVTVNFKDCPKLSKSFFERTIIASGGVGFTLIVHPDVYAKLTDENNPAWNTILTYLAPESGVTIATTGSQS